MNRLVISEDLWNKARAHLLDTKGERFAFFSCGVSDGPRGLSFLARELLPIPDDGIELAGGYKVKVPALLKVTNRARKTGDALVECHSHPWVDDDVEFSDTDLYGLKEFVPYILEDLPGQPYAATVWGANSLDALCWRSPGKSELMDEVVIVGRTVVRLHCTSTLRGKSVVGKEGSSTTRGRMSRQELAIEQAGQRRVRSTKVGIIGLGGLGSYIAQQLAYQGIRDFVLVDPDTVDGTSLNRLVGAGPADIGMLKVDVASREISRISGTEQLSIQAFASNLRTVSVLQSLKGVDVIIGCLDNDGARLILNELACAYLIPLIDCAVGINVEGGKIVEAGGRVVTVLPDGPCLLCCKEIDIGQAYNDLSSPDEVARRRALGYAGPETAAASVISLNGVVASIGAQEFLALVTGIRPSRTFTFYDMMEHEGKLVVPRLVSQNPKCLACSLKGVGDKSWMERYVEGSGQWTEYQAGGKHELR